MTARTISTRRSSRNCRSAKGRSGRPAERRAKLLGGWQVNGLIAAYSGQPFTVTAAGTSLNAPNNSQRANVVKSGVAILGGTGPNQSYFDPLAFAPVTTAAFGTSSFDMVRGPGTFNFDAGLFREFHVTERFKIQFRAESLNVTNTPHFSNPGNNVSNMVLNTDGSDPQPRWIHRDHQHPGQWARGHRRADVPLRSARHVLATSLPSP